MKRWTLFLSLLLSAAGQSPVEPPSLGVYADRQGQMRRLYGVAGNLLPGPVMETGVLSCQALGERVAWKTADRLFLRLASDAPPRSWDAPPGAARFRFDSGAIHVWFDDAQTGWIWRSDLADFVPAGWLRQEDFPETGTLGAWRLLRSDEGLWLQRNDDLLAIPAAAGDGPRLYEIASGAELPVNGPIVFPTVGPGDSFTKRFRIRNETADPLTINRLSISGGGDFAITDGFTPPRIIATGRFEDFWLRFAPQSPGARAGTLYINTTTFEVQGSAPVWASLQASEPDGWVTLSSAKAYDMGSAERNSELRRTFRFINLNSEPVLLPAVTVTGGRFSLQQGWGEARHLEPGDTAGFDIVFTGAVAGTFAASIEAGAQKFPISATAREYPLPKPLISFPSAIESARQEKLRVTFADPPRAAGTGLLKLEFHPAAGMPDDPSILFPVNGTRTATFRAVDGGGAADFSGQDGIIVQTGTTAGAITLTVTFGTHTEVLRVEIRPSPVVVDSAQGLKSDTRIDVRFSAFDNTHQASQLAFTFYQKNGQVVTPGRMTANVAQLMAGYFSENPRVGGIFSLRAAFPVTGAAADIDRVDVEIVNAAGTTKLESIKF